MLEQKHGNKFRLFDLESCVPSISLERLCELCKHIEAWLNSGHNKIVVLQDRLVSSRLRLSRRWNTAKLDIFRILFTHYSPSVESHSVYKLTTPQLLAATQKTICNACQRVISNQTSRRARAGWPIFIFFLSFFLLFDLLGLLSSYVWLNSTSSRTNDVKKHCLNIFLLVFAGKIFNELEYPWQLIYNTRRSVVQVLRHTHWDLVAMIVTIYKI